MINTGVFVSEIYLLLFERHLSFSSKTNDITKLIVSV